ncbi:MAG: hypothetical protein C4518_15485 [Desulfobacteraceae bacterium]|nr:MAG: hypothetical protein C4518_15485 [Desulfobacteraceae bacterium]
MTTKDDEGSLGAEVSSRLDELFGDDESGAPVEKISVAKQAKNPPKKTAAPVAESAVTVSDEDSPIRNLKALVFSIDWEITDETMVDFLTETKRLMQKYKDDQILTLFLKLHESIGKYIKAKKARAHPDAIAFVASVYKNFEKVLLSPGMQEKQKKQLLGSEVKKFKEFKQRILLRDGASEDVQAELQDSRAAAASAKTPEKSLATGASLPLQSKEALDYIVEQLKKEIKAEFHTLRQIIKNLGA